MVKTKEIEKNKIEEQNNNNEVVEKKQYNKLLKENEELKKTIDELNNKLKEVLKSNSDFDMKDGFYYYSENENQNSQIYYVIDDKGVEKKITITDDVNEKFKLQKQNIITSFDKVKIIHYLPIEDAKLFVKNNCLYGRYKKCFIVKDKVEKK